MRRNQSVSLEQALAEVQELKARLEEENLSLRKEIAAVTRAGDGILGESAAIRNVLIQAEQVAPTDATVLLLGQTGTGKELLARTIHVLSARRDRVMVTVNCAALPPTLIEAELFGRERGAYTGRWPGKLAGSKPLTGPRSSWTRSARRGSRIEHAIRAAVARAKH